MCVFSITEAYLIVKRINWVHWLLDAMFIIYTGGNDVCDR